jgi:hypothetical protein
VARTPTLERTRRHRTGEASHDAVVHAELVSTDPEQLGARDALNHGNPRPPPVTIDARSEIDPDYAPALIGMGIAYCAPRCTRRR